MATKQIVSGHNNDGSLVDITTITPSGDIPFYEPVALGNYEPGIQRIRADGRWYETGFASTTWVFTLLSNVQYDYLYDNYANDTTNDNKVTIATPGRDGEDTNYNARIILPPRSELEYRPSNQEMFENVEIRFVRLEAI